MLATPLFSPFFSFFIFDRRLHLHKKEGNLSQYSPCSSGKLPFNRAQIRGYLSRPLFQQGLPELAQALFSEMAMSPGEDTESPKGCQASFGSRVHPWLPDVESAISRPQKGQAHLHKVKVLNCIETAEKKVNQLEFRTLSICSESFVFI